MSRKRSMSITMLGITLWIVSNSRPTRSETAAAIPVAEGMSKSASESEQMLDALEQEVNKLYPAERYEEVIEKTKIYLTLCEKTERCKSSRRNISSALNNLGSAHAELEQYSDASEAFEKAYKIDLELAGETRGENWLAAANDIHQLAWVFYASGDYKTALHYNLKALEMRQNATPKSADETIVSINNIGSIYTLTGEYHKAENYLQEVVNYYRINNPKSINYATALSNLADVYAKLAKYHEAITEQRTAISLVRALPNVESSVMISSYGTLGNIYRSAGAFALSKQAYEYALQYSPPGSQAKTAKEATLYHNLGRVYQKMAERTDDKKLARQYLDSSKRHLDDSLKIRQALFKGKANPDIAYSYDGLAVLSKTAGKLLYQGEIAAQKNAYENAMIDQKEAIRIFSECFDKSPEHPALNGALLHLAQLFEAKALVDDHEQAKEDKAEATGLYDRVVRNRRSQLLDDEHPDVIEAQHRLAMAHAAGGQLDKAIAELEVNLDASEKLLQRIIGGFGDARVVDFLRILRAQEEEVYSLTQQHLASPALGRLALKTALLRKGLALELSAERSRMALSSPSMSPAAVQLRDARTKLANLELGEPPDSAKRKAWLKDRTDLRTLIDSLDEQLAHELGTKGGPTKALTPKTILSQIGNHIPSDGAMINFVAYCPECIDRVGVDWAQLHYLAFLLIPGPHQDGSNEPSIEVFDLGSGKDIAHEFLQFAMTVSTHPGSRSNPALDPKKFGQALYQRIMHPIVSKLGNKKTLFLSPDGLFQQMPFIALHDGDSYLVDRFQFVYLNSGRELLRDVEHGVSQLSVTVLADPEFSSVPNQTVGCGGNPGASPSPESPSDWQVRSFAQRRNKTPDSLPGTCQEAKFIEAIWPKARVLLGRDATERALRETVSPGLLHIGTHAAFLGTESAAAYEVARYNDMDMALSVQDPLLQARLLLAKDKQNDRDDGIATALELSGLNLQGTQLVVLPDCDTALGQISRGEGVYGLRSAIMIAGAETLIASLWKVDDTSAPEMVAKLYTNILQGRTRSEALHFALQSVQQTHPDPYFWGSLVLVGQPGKMRGLASTPPQIPPLPPPCRTSTSALRWFGLGLLLCGLLAMSLLASRRVLSRAE